MKSARRPAKVLLKPASPEAIRRAAGISAARVTAVRRLIAELGLDGALVPPKPASGKRSIKPKSAARMASR